MMAVFFNYNITLILSLSIFFIDYKVKLTYFAALFAPFCKKMLLRSKCGCLDDVHMMHHLIGQ
jgi:hypothetical protein